MINILDCIFSFSLLLHTCITYPLQSLGQTCCMTLEYYVQISFPYYSLNSVKAGAVVFSIYASTSW